jgi:hypothetical protein
LKKITENQKPKLPALAKLKQAKTPEARSLVAVFVSSEADMDAAVARTLTRPEVGSAAVIEAWGKGTHDVNALSAELSAQVDAVNAGQMARAEGILIAQAHTLDAIFVTLMRRAVHQTMMPQWDAYMRMGMKAQSQCRATLQALADLKNPPVFAKQANIANGPQQVNNGVMSGPKGDQAPVAPARGEVGNRQTRLLEGAQHGGKVLDAGAASATKRSNPEMEAMGAIHRPKISRRKK